MLKGFEIEGFRTFKSLRIDRLARVNLVVGGNNVGKTMLLEALRLYVDGAHFASITRLLLTRNEVASLAAPSRAVAMGHELPTNDLADGGARVRARGPNAGASPGLAMGSRGAHRARRQCCQRTGRDRSRRGDRLDSESCRSSRVGADGDVDGFLDGIPVSARRFAVKDRSKARVHAWLAAQEQPGRPLGLAIKARYLDAEAAAVAPFLAWLRAALID